MNIVIPGGTGHLGNVLSRALVARGHRIVILSRGRPRSESESRLSYRSWDGRSLGDWAEAIDGADVVINLAGRSVDCRYHARNLREMFDSRVQSTRVVGEAISRATAPPATWLQMSTATIYAHRYDADNDEVRGILGGDESDVPDYWRFSIDIATLWEAAMSDAHTPATRKVALRTAMVMSPTDGGAFATLSNLTRAGLGGTVSSGQQFMSWIHDEDFVRAIEFLIEHPELEGPVNLAAPSPVPQREFMRALRSAWGIPFGLPTPRWLLGLGAFVLRTDPELVLKSRRVVPGALVDLGFEFRFPMWGPAAADLVHRRRSRSEGPALPAAS